MSQSPSPGGSLPDPVPPRGSGRDRKPLHRGTVFVVRGWRRALVYLCSGFLRLYHRSLRLKWREEDLQAMRALQVPPIIVVWHNRSLAIPAVTRFLPFSEPPAVMVSASRMAAWQDAAYRDLGLCTIRGSSTRRSVAATRELLAAWQKGHPIALSPDGPSGPCYTVQRGVAAMARMTDAPLLFLCLDSRWAWRMRSWDRHFVPIPFAPVEVRVVLLDPFSAGYLAEEESRFLEMARGKFLASTFDHGTMLRP